MCIINVYTRERKDTTHEKLPKHCTVLLKAIYACTPQGERARRLKLIYVPSSSPTFQRSCSNHSILLSDSRRFALVVPAADVREVDRFHIDVFVVV